LKGFKVFDSDKKISIFIDTKDVEYQVMISGIITYLIKSDMGVVN